MTDEQFIKRASLILHHMALEREGFWAGLFRRWCIHHEPLRHDASYLLREYGYRPLMEKGTRYVGEKDT